MSQEKDDRNAIIRVVEAMAAAQTADELVAQWVDEATWFDVVNLVLEGDEARNHYRKQFEMITNLRTDILKINARADGNLGYAYSVQHFLADGANGGPDIDMVFRQTDCMARTDGTWKVVHQHVSLPIDMATGMAVTDAKP